MNPDLKQFLLTKYNNCVSLVIHNDGLRQSLLKFYFAFVAGIFVLLGFVISLVAPGKNLGGVIAGVIKNFDVVGGASIILVMFTLCLGVWCLYLHRGLRIKSIRQLKAMADIRHAFTEGLPPTEAEKYLFFLRENKDKGISFYCTAGTDIYYTRIFAFSNSMFLLCLVILYSLFTKLSISFEWGLIVTMVLSAILAIIFYFIQLKVIYLGYLRKLDKES